MIANHKGEIPFLILSLPFILGIGLAITFPSPANINWLVTMAVILNLIFITLNLAYTKLSIYKHRWIGGGLIATILFLAGYISLINNNELNNKKHFSKAPAQYLAAKISNEPVFKNGWLRFTVDIEQTVNNNKRAAATGTLLITLK
ncbi:MAG: hypothetical protein ABI113_12710, partial [Mucilaginibacter sp.]